MRIFRSIKFVGNNLLAVVIIEVFGHCAGQTNRRIKIFYQIQGILKQFRIFSNIFFKAFWPLCGPDKQGNQFLISHFEISPGLKWPSKNQYHEHSMGSYHQDPMRDHYCMHDHDTQYVDYRIHIRNGFFLAHDNGVVFSVSPSVSTRNFGTLLLCSLLIIIGATLVIK